MFPQLPNDINSLILQFAGMPHPYPDNEWAEVTQNYPSLQRQNCWRTRENNGLEPTFNCVGWSIGDTNCLEWNHDLTAMINWYALHNFEQTGTGSAGATIDLWVNERGTFAHAAKRYTGLLLPGMPLDLWESAPWPDDTFTHGRLEIMNNLQFARVGASLRPSANGASIAASSSSSSPSSSSSSAPKTKQRRSGRKK